MVKIKILIKGLIFLYLKYSIKLIIVKIDKNKQDKDRIAMKKR